MILAIWAPHTIYAGYENTSSQNKGLQLLSVKLAVDLGRGIASLRLIVPRCNLLEDSESEDNEAVGQGRNNEARATIIVRPPLRAA
jgi:hypothetical protein